MKIVMPAEIEVEVGSRFRFVPPHEARFFQGDNQKTVDFCKKYAEQECVMVELKESPLVASGDPFTDMDNIRHTIAGDRIMVRFPSTEEEHEIKTSWLVHLGA